MKRPYYLKKRGDSWYYRLNPESKLTAGENLNYYTTGCRSRDEAEAFMAEMLGERPETPTFRRYAEPLLLWGLCPHTRRVLEETGRFKQAMRKAKHECSASTSFPVDDNWNSRLQGGSLDITCLEKTRLRRSSRGVFDRLTS